MLLRMLLVVCDAFNVLNFSAVRVLFGLSLSVFTARCYATQSAVMRLYVVCLTVTIRYRDHTGWNSSKIISRPNSLRLVLSLTPTRAIWCNGNTSKIISPPNIDKFVMWTFLRWFWAYIQFSGHSYIGRMAHRAVVFAIAWLLVRFVADPVTVHVLITFVKFLCNCNCNYK